MSMWLEQEVACQIAIVGNRIGHIHVPIKLLPIIESGSSTVSIPAAAMVGGSVASKGIL